MKIISGGQTGVDQAALYAARKVGIPTGGYIPRGFRTQNGNRPEFALNFGMKPTVSRNYQPRTMHNVIESDATLRIAEKWDSPGEILTLKYLKEYNKDYLDVKRFVLNSKIIETTVVNWIKNNEIYVLNVAGNSEKTSPGIFEEARRFLEKVFQKIIDKPYQMRLF